MNEAAYEQTLTVARRQVGGERRIEVLNVAVDVLIERGFDQTRFADISSASGVPVSTLQYYFGSLECLLIEAVLYTSDRDISRARAEAAGIDDPWKRLLWLVDVFMPCDTPGTGWQSMIEFWRAAFRRPHLRGDLARDQDAWRSLVTDTITDGIARGVFSPSRDPELIAMQFTALFDGATFPGLIGNPSFDAGAFRAAAIEDLAHLLKYDLAAEER